MSVTFRVIALLLITTVFLAGPLAPFARAQQPQPPMTPGGEIFPESLKTTPADAVRGHPALYDVGAGVADVFYVPGKVILCTLGVGVGVALLAITFGSGYRAAAGAGREGCGGKWILTGRDLVPDESAARAFDWELDSSR
jgi:hypothetical protein